MSNNDNNPNNPPPFRIVVPETLELWDLDGLVKRYPRPHLRYLRDALIDYFAEEHPGFKAVIQIVAQHFRIAAEDIIGRSRHHKFVWPRQIAMALCAEMFNQTTKEVAAVFKRHHTLVNTARRQFLKHQKSVPGRIELDRIRQAVHAELAKANSSRFAVSSNDLLPESCRFPDPLQSSPTHARQHRTETKETK